MREFSGEWALSIAQRIAFERTGGSAEEAKAARIIASSLRRVGLRPKTEQFRVASFRRGKASASVIAPYRKTYEALPVGLTGSTGRRGITAEFVYRDVASRCALSDSRGKIVMLGSRLNRDQYRDLIDSGAAAFVLVCEPLKRVYFKIPHTYIKKFGAIPGVSLTFEDSMEILKRKASRMTLTSKQIQRSTFSQNVVAEIRGTKYPDERILISAHYDSVPLSAGVHDNAAGSAIAAELAGIFSQEPPLRTLCFCWFGSEELGLLGSFACAARLKSSIKNLLLVLNIDVGGGIIGSNSAFIVGADELRYYVEAAAKEHGVGLETRQEIYSSDSVPFAEAGVPSINLYRAGGSSFYVHSNGDSKDFLTADALSATGRFALLLLRRLANAAEFPLERKIPDTLKKKLEEYVTKRLGRDYNPPKTLTQERK
jgi:hypothetical protein